MATTTITMTPTILFFLKRYFNNCYS